MDSLPSDGLYFSSPRPTAVELPHLLTALDAELLGKVADLTKSRLGIWPLPAPYDDEDRFDNTREVAPLSSWRLGLNQGEILAFSLFIQESVFGSKCLFLDAATDEATLTRLLVTPGHKLETGAWVTLGYQDAPGLEETLQGCGWALIPAGPERGKALFIARPASAGLVQDLAAWCDRDGRARGQFVLGTQGLELQSHAAPEGSRSRAVQRQLDLFLGRYETYFGSPPDTLGAVVNERIRTRRELQEKIARARSG